MQIEFDDIRGGECLLRERGEEEFVDHARACDANRALLETLGVGGHHHAA